MMSILKIIFSKCRSQAFILLIASILFSFLPSGNAQETEDEVFYFENRVAFVISTSTGITPKKHFLGEELGKKDAVFHDLYSYTVTGQITNTGQQVVIEKPLIYLSVKKTNRYYRKLLKKKQITEDEAKEKVDHLLDVAISIFTQNTTAFENELRQTKEMDEIAGIFERVILR
jgi:hypothetical protein